MTTITPNKLITEPNINDLGWGLTLNTDFSLIDQALGSSFPISTTGGTTALIASTAQVGGVSWYNAQQIVVSGALTSNATITIPTYLTGSTPNTFGGAWIITNNTTNNPSTSAFTLTFVTAGTGSSGSGVTINQGSSAYVFSNGTSTSYADSNITSGNPTFNNLTVNGKLTLSTVTTSLSAILNNISETVTVSGSGAGSTINYYITSQSVLYYTGNASSNFTLNFAASSGTALNAALSTGQSVTVAFLCTNGTTAYYNSAITIDGTSVTPKWINGSTPTSGHASSIDVYTYTIIKTGSAAYTVLATLAKFA